MISRKLRNSIIIMIITGFIILNHFYYTMIFWAVNGFFDSFNFNIAAIVFLGSYMIFVSYLHHTYKICSFRQYIISIGSDINFYLVVYPFLRLVINFLIVAFFQFLFLSHVVHAETTTSSIVTSGENTPSETVSTTNPIRFAIGFTLTCVILGGLVFYFNGTFDETWISKGFSTDFFDALSGVTHNTPNPEAVVASLAAAAAAAAGSSSGSSVQPTNSFPDIVMPSPQNIYELFVQYDQEFKDPDLIFITLKTCMPSTMWDLDLEATYDGRSPVKLYIDSFDKVVMPKESSYMYHFARIKAAISAYNLLSATGNLDNKEMFMTYYVEMFNRYANQYAEFLGKI